MCCRVGSPEALARVAAAVDTQFVNSRAPTKTESEKEFQQSFVQMFIGDHHILAGHLGRDRGIILLVLANTIVMSVRGAHARVRGPQDPRLLGRQLAGFVLGEALVISLSGGVLGLLLTFRS